MQSEPGRIEASTRASIADAANIVLLSAASAWAIAIKHSLGRLPLPLPPAEYVVTRMASSATAALPIDHRHALQVARLPDHHRDPFDRMLVAQAQLEDMFLVTADTSLGRYDVKLMWA